MDLWADHRRLVAEPAVASAYPGRTPRVVDRCAVPRRTRRHRRSGRPCSPWRSRIANTDRPRRPLSLSLSRKAFAVLGLVRPLLDATGDDDLGPRLRPMGTAV